MGKKKLWKILQRLDISQSLIVAICASSGVVGMAKAIWSSMGQAEPPWWIPMIAAGLCGAVIILVLRQAQGRVKQQKLRIHSAVYGTDSITDRDVAEILRKAETSGLVLSVDNNTLRCDPAPNRPKRIEVTYSYGNDAVLSATRPEGTRLILPEDSQLIGRTAAEYDKKRQADLANQAAQHKAPLEAAESKRLEPTVEGEPSPQWTTDEKRMADRAASEFTSLGWKLKIATQLIYRSPMLQASEINRQLGNLGFQDPDNAILKPLLGTNLVQKDYEGRVGPSPYAPISRTEEKQIRVGASAWL